ncbi:MAG: site-2 protease family protein [Clostridia bacterium]|nr:site-2 protease family protein [Clostridia bacterium]
MFDIFSREGLITFLYTLPALVLSLSIHEYAHAWVAYKLGDISQKIRGRLTLNPLAHIDPIGFIAIVLVGVGWGKPVTVDDRNFKDSRKGMMLTSLAGPASNLLLAILVTIILKLLMVFGVMNSIINSNTGNIILNMLLYVIQFNIVFGIFNLIPLPPLDGSKVLAYFLPQRARGFMYTLERYSFIIIMIIYFTNLTSYIIAPGYNLVLKLINWILML